MALGRRLRRLGRWFLGICGVAISGYWIVGFGIIHGWILSAWIRAETWYVKCGGLGEEGLNGHLSFSGGAEM